ncbi:MAG: hypothetical protein JWO03_2284 [Bacteroidetes bacterium]|nr:hypothetical protein [Bacteroidota bacterium]
MQFKNQYPIVTPILTTNTTKKMKYPYPCPSPLRRGFLQLLLLAILIVVSFSMAFAQCTGCTSTITTNTSAVTIATGQVVCINYAGTFTKAIIMTGGTLCIGPATTVSTAVTIPTGAAMSIYGSYTGSMTQNGGAITTYSGGTFHPSSYTVNGGSLTINSGGTAILGTPTFPSGYVLTNNGAITIAGFTLNSGATMTLTGTSQTISGSVTNNGTLTIDGPSTISGSFSQNSGAVASFINGVTVTGSVANNGTINLNGAFSVGGAYTSNSSATIKATGTSGCNSVTVGGLISGAGTFNGSGYAMTISPTPACCMSNGATGAPATPTQQPTAIAGSISGNTVNGSFTAPSASIAGYIVLRYVGTVAPGCNPVNNTAYSVGDAIGSCTVAAKVTGGSTGTKNFTDDIPPATTNCGKNVYYRIFSYNGTGACTMFNTTSPLTSSLPIASFTATVTGTATFCAGVGTTLTASAGVSYAWNTTATTQAITASAGGTYTVTVTSDMGCTATASKAVNANAVPNAVITASGAMTFCAPGSVTLTASGGGTYLWSTGASTAAITASSSNTYIVTVTNAAGCKDTAIKVVTVNASPTATTTVSGATTFCTGGSVTLTASGGGTYLWSTGASMTAIAATTSGTYIVTVTNAAGCTDTSIRVVTVNAKPTPTVNSPAICTGATATLTATGGGTYLWNTTATTTSITTSTAGTYTVTVTAANTCTATASGTVTVNALPTPTVNSATICSGASATLTVTGGGTYLWSTAATTSSISTSTAGTYRVTVTTASGCTASASGTVTVNTAPSPTVNSPTICAGATATLTATGGGTYLWSTAATSASITTSTAGTYTVTVTAANTCTATANGVVTVRANPTLSASSNTPACIGTSITLLASASGAASYTYSWSGPAGFTSTSASSSVNNATTTNGGTYNVTVTDNNTCTATASATVIVDASCVDSTTVGANGGGSSDAPCTQILRFDHYNDAVAGAGGQNHTWILKNGNMLTMTITRTAGNFTAVTAPTWSGAAFGQSGYTGLTGKTVLYTPASGYSKVIFSNIQMKDSLGATINNFTLLGLDAESTDNAERDTLVSNGTVWFDYDTITPPGIGSVPSEIGIGTSTLVWTGTGPANARSRLVSTNNPTSFSFSTVAGGLQGFAMGVSNPVQAPSAITICSNSSFNATPTNLPAGTTYTWTAPVVSPAGSITGASAQSTAVAVVGQALINTSGADATATYTVVPSNNCSGLGYTVTITVKPAPTATITTSGPACMGGNITVTATPSAGAPLTYAWSGPSSFTSTSNIYTITSGTAAKAGTYNVTITGSNTCTATSSAAVSFVNCVSVSGSIFDDGTGKGVVNARDTVSSFGQTVYAVIADTNGLVINSGLVAANGSFTVGNILPSTSGMTIRMSTVNPTAGAVVPAASWPANWLGTLGQYGTNNLAGTGVYNNANELIPVKTGTSNITGMMIGFDRLAPPVNQQYTISRPPRHTIKSLTTAAGLGNVTWTDPEDGVDKGSFVVSSVANMHSNILFYDSNANNTLDTNEAVKGYRVINTFNFTRLKIKFEGVSSINAAFAFAYIDSAGKTNPTTHTYTVTWTGGALPVKLEYFTAEKRDEHASLLKWTTVSEINNDRFEIERSDNATEWFKIGEVKGAGNSNDNIDYTLVDDQPLEGANYYRLKQVDMDGHYEYSDVTEVEFGAAQHSTTVMTLYPNPLHTGKPLNIALAGTADGIKLITITDALGQPVYKYEPSNEQGYKIPALNLPSGTYIVNVISQANESFGSKIIIQ